jgi:hypothetical protein
MGGLQKGLAGRQVADEVIGEKAGVVVDGEDELLNATPSVKV